MIFLSTAQFVANSLSRTAGDWIAPEVDAEFTLAREGLAGQHRHAIHDMLTLKAARLWYLRRRDARRIEQAIIRLSAVSHHLLDDIGLDDMGMIDAGLEDAARPVGAKRPASPPEAAPHLPATVIHAA